MNNSIFFTIGIQGIYINVHSKNSLQYFNKINNRTTDVLYRYIYNIINKVEGIANDINIFLERYTCKCIILYYIELLCRN